MAETDLILSMHTDGSTTQYRSYTDMSADVIAEIERPRGATAENGQQKAAPEPAPQTKPQGSQNKEQKSKAAADKDKEKEKEKARRSGDLRYYQTYGQSMGWSRAWVFLAISILFAVVSRISRKLVWHIIFYLCATSANVFEQNTGSRGSLTTLTSTVACSSACTFCFLSWPSS